MGLRRGVQSGSPKKPRKLVISVGNRFPSSLCRCLISVLRIVGTFLSLWLSTGLPSFCHLVGPNSWATHMWRLILRFPLDPLLPRYKDVREGSLSETKDPKLKYVLNSDFFRVDASVLCRS